MKLAALIGEPATGKTTTAWEFLKMLSVGMPFKKGLVVGTEHSQEKIVVIGRYEEGDVWAGTDRLSMAAMPAVEWFIEHYSTKGPDWSIFYEGDRLTSAKFFESIKRRVDLKIFVLEAPESIKTERHKLRGDTQSEQFLKGRKTKIRKIQDAFPDHVPVQNVEPGDPIKTTKKILNFLKTRRG